MCGVTDVAQECVISDWLLNDISWIESHQIAPYLLPWALNKIAKNLIVIVGSYADQKPASDNAAEQPIMVLEYIDNSEMENHM